MIDGYIGEVRHVELNMASDFCADPSFPMMWRMERSVAGSGALGDMGTYIIDMARWLVGEFVEVSGVLKTYITERPRVAGNPDFFETIAFANSKDAPLTGEMVKVDNDDEALFLAAFEGGTTGDRSSRTGPE